MAQSPHPEIGNWYQGQDGLLFRVVAIDDDETTIEIQYFEGEVDELDFEAWNELSLEAVPPPEDWSGAYDDLEADDLGYTDMNLRPAGQPFSLDDLEPED